MFKERKSGERLGASEDEKDRDSEREREIKQFLVNTREREREGKQLLVNRGSPRRKTSQRLYIDTIFGHTNYSLLYGCVTVALLPCAVRRIVQCTGRRTDVVALLHQLAGAT